VNRDDLEIWEASYGINDSGDRRDFGDRQKTLRPLRFFRILALYEMLWRLRKNFASSQLLSSRAGFTDFSDPTQRLIFLAAATIYIPLALFIFALSCHAERNFERILQAIGMIDDSLKEDEDDAADR